MEPIVAELIASTAEKLVAPITERVTKKTRALILGTEEQQALQRITARAMDHAVGAALRGKDPDLVVHVLSLLERLIAQQQATGIALPVPGAEFAASDIRTWEEIARVAGLDTATLPVSLPVLVVEYLESFHDVFQKEVEDASNPLFGRYIVAELGQIRSDLAMLTLTPADSSESHLIMFDNILSAALENARNRAHHENRVIRTPDVLYALLAIRYGASWTVFNSVEDDLASRVKDKMRKYMRSPGIPRYSPVNWSARPDIRLAKNLAWVDGQASLSEAYLLCALLRSSSSTQQQLRDWLGARYRLLCGFAAEARKMTILPPTPDFLFGP